MSSTSDIKLEELPELFRELARQFTRATTDKDVKTASVWGGRLLRIATQSGVVKWPTASGDFDWPVDKWPPSAEVNELYRTAWSVFGLFLIREHQRRLPAFDWMGDDYIQHVVIQTRELAEFSAAVATLIAREIAPAESIPPAPKCRVSVDGRIVTVDGKPHSLVGTDKVTQRIAGYVVDLIEANGEYMPRPADVKTREIEKQPKEIKTLIEAQPGAGSRIPKEKLWLN